MKTTMYEATLRPASGGFGEYDRDELVALEGCEDFAEFEALLDEGPHCWRRVPSGVRPHGAIYGETLVSDDPRPCESRLYVIGEGDEESYVMVYRFAA